MRSKIRYVVVGALRPLSVGISLMVIASTAFAECDTDRSFCANHCSTARGLDDRRAIQVESTWYSDEQRAEAKQEAATIRAEAREDYKVCLNNCDAEYNACAGRRVNEDYDD